MNRGLEIKEFHCFETHLNRIRDLGESLGRISEAMSSECRPISED